GDRSRPAALRSTPSSAHRSRQNQAEDAVDPDSALRPAGGGPDRRGSCGAMTTTAMTPAPRRAPIIRPRIVLALFPAAGLSRFAYFYLDDLTRHIPGTLLRRVLEEGTGIVAAAALFPIAVLVERRFPLDRGRWRRHWPAHLGGLLAYS